MAKASMRFITTTKDKLNDITVVNGQLIFSRDERIIYLDASGERTPYQTVMVVKDDATRQALQSPVEGIYYTREENILWSYYDSSWKQITGVDSNLIIADGTLPSTGKRNALYLDDTTLYR